MKKVFIIGIGAGNPYYVTVQAINALHSHDVTMPAHLGAQNAETVLRIVVGDALDKASQNFLVR